MLYLNFKMVVVVFFVLFLQIHEATNIFLKTKTVR